MAYNTKNRKKLLDKYRRTCCCSKCCCSKCCCSKCCCSKCCCSKCCCSKCCCSKCFTFCFTAKFWKSCFSSECFKKWSISRFRLKRLYVKVNKKIALIDNNTMELSDFATEIRMQILKEKNILQPNPEKIDLYDKISRNLLDLGKKRFSAMEKRMAIADLLRTYCNHDVD